MDYGENLDDAAPRPVGDDVRGYDQLPRAFDAPRSPHRGVKTQGVYPRDNQCNGPGGSQPAILGDERVERLQIAKSGWSPADRHPRRSLSITFFALAAETNSPRPASRRPS